MGGLFLQEAVRLESTYLTPRPEMVGREPVRYGIDHLDMTYIAGVKPGSPQINVIQGGPGSRKTTLAMNVISNMLLCGNMPDDILSGIDSLESGMTIERLALVLRCMIATKILIYEHHTGPQGPDTVWRLLNRELPGKMPQDLIGEVRSASGLAECIFKPDVIESWYAGNLQLTSKQTNAWERAGEIMNSFPLVLFGTSEHPDDNVRESRSIDTTNIEQSYNRWIQYHDSFGLRHLMTDFIQEYFIPGVFEDYNKQQVIGPWHSKWAKKVSGTMWAILQEGKGDLMEVRRGRVPLGGSGGMGYMQKAQLNLRVDYNKQVNPFWIVCTSMKARRGDFPQFAAMIDPTSGAIFGKSVDFGKVEHVIAGR